VCVKYGYCVHVSPVTTIETASHFASDSQPSRSALILLHDRRAGVAQSLRLFYLCVSHPIVHGSRGGVVVKALRHKPAGPGIDSRWCHWIFQ
jgi:hypothetical protein